eukprot:TRINITY_DN24016_c0_g1_i2.p1 TRINITY_DN24016_c0_g1~~TRINITY_DN24016_c0_g1_i2.p1  ORF type:complete len:331 (+),score=59.80 TRINITY_DN24016_c0_g1_i2:99-1091(+)
MCIRDSHSWSSAYSILLVVVLAVILGAGVNYRFGSVLDLLWSKDEDATRLRVVVSGASSGIGEQIVYRWASRNASLLIVARRASLLQAVAQQALQLGATEVHTIVADFSTVEASKHVVDSASRLLGGMDVLHLNHAHLSRRDWVTESSLEELGTMLRVSFTSFVEVATLALPMLQLSGGRIVVSSSAAGETAVQGQSSYSAAKHALHGFFKSFQQDLTWHHANVSVTIAVIGRVETEGSAAMLGSQHYFVPTVAATTVAAAIVDGGVARKAELLLPWSQIWLNRWFARIAPRIHAAIVILSAQSDPCTNTYEVYLPFKCWDKIASLVSRT